MYVKLVLTVSVFCAVVLKTKCEKNYDEKPFMHQAYTRIKRGKYYSTPQKFYSRPPMSSAIRGPFSYTLPPNYMADEDEPAYPGPPRSYSRRPKVSKRPTNEGLGDDDINNIVKYLSKKDLQKLIDLAGGGQDKGGDEYPKDLFEKQTEYIQPHKSAFKSTHISKIPEFNSEKYSLQAAGDDDNKLFKALVEQIDFDPKDNVQYHETKPFNVDLDSEQQQELNSFSIEYSKPRVSTPSEFQFVTSPAPPQAYFADSKANKFYDTAALEAEESMLQKQIAFLKSQIDHGVVYTDSKMMPEEVLPKPMNLREEQDYDISSTNNVQTVIKADQSNSYKLENFGDLPLMSYNSKLDTLSSYHVPHYTVTSQSKPSSPTSSFYGQYSPAYSAPSPYGSKVPPVSDAHLKVVRIWSHKSKGTAYTLHDDGTLTLEKPGRPKGSYGYP